MHRSHFLLHFEKDPTHCELIGVLPFNFDGASNSLRFLVLRKAGMIDPLRKISLSVSDDSRRSLCSCKVFEMVYKVHKRIMILPSSETPWNDLDRPKLCNNLTLAFLLSQLHFL